LSKRIGVETKAIGADSLPGRCRVDTPVSFLKAAWVGLFWVGVVWVGLFSAAILGCTGAEAQSGTAATSSIDGNSDMSQPARTWIVSAVNTELNALRHKGSYLRYHMHVVDAKGDQLRDVIESKDGSVARLIMRSGRPLTAEEDQAERDRLQAMLDSPASFARHMKNDAQEKKTAEELIKLMPDAMLYSYVPGQPQTPNGGGQMQIVIDYKPNPHFSPPTTISQALQGLRGRVWMDSQSRQLIRIEGEIFQSVNFGWGVVAHIYPGGKLLLEQTNAGGGRWIFSHFLEEVTVRALMVKTVKVHEDVHASDFQTLPGPMSYQDAIHVLLNTPLPTR
jgi:hypothetical protein